MFFTRINGQSSRLTSVDHTETYGRYLLRGIVKDLVVGECLDIGCGEGHDLEIVKKCHNNAKMFGVDFRSNGSPKLNELGIETITLDIEKEKLPFENESLDFILANQVLEHTKEVFWINHEIFRCLKVGGSFFLGVPNVLSFHNRILMLFGYHPTCNKMISAHVRVFSKRDVALFDKTIGNSFCHLEKFSGANFYPFPKKIARFLSSIFPNNAVANFYLIKKTGEYKSEFIKYPTDNRLETNYFIG